MLLRLRGLGYNRRVDEFKPKLVVNNVKPEKARKIRKLPAVSRYCPVCQSSTWAYAYQGAADMNIKPLRVRYCLYCMAKGKVTTW